MPLCKHANRWHRDVICQVNTCSSFCAFNRRRKVKQIEVECLPLHTRCSATMGLSLSLSLFVKGDFPLSLRKLLKEKKYFLSGSLMFKKEKNRCNEQCGFCSMFLHLPSGSYDYYFVLVSVGVLYSFFKNIQFMLVRIFQGDNLAAKERGKYNN